VRETIINVTKEINEEKEKKKCIWSFDLNTYYMHRVDNDADELTIDSKSRSIH